jgi:hypothetical protein
VLNKRKRLEQHIVALLIRTDAMAAEIARLQLDVHTLKSQRKLEEMINVPRHHTK